MHPLAFFYSLAGLRYYPLLVRGGVRRALRYLLLLVLFVVIVFGARNYVRVGRVLAAVAEDMAGWPDFSLRDGRLSFKGRMPYYAYSGNTVYLIDTTGATGPEALNRYTNGFLLTATHVYLKDPLFPSTPIAWRDLPFETTRDRLAGSLGRLFWPIFALVVLYLLLGNLAGKALAACVLGLAGWLATGCRGLTYGQSLAAAAYALTGPTLLAIAKNLFFPHAPAARYFGWLYWGLAAAWTILAVLRVKRSMAPAAGAGQAGDDRDLDLI
ncbi:MAG: DUF1189 family protein [Patescibacteria group bacterium]